MILSDSIEVKASALGGECSVRPTYEKLGGSIAASAPADKSSGTIYFTKEEIDKMMAEGSAHVLVDHVDKISSEWLGTWSAGDHDGDISVKHPEEVTGRFGDLDVATDKEILEAYSHKHGAIGGRAGKAMINEAFQKAEKYDQIEEIFHKWYPEEELTEEVFKGLAARIMKETIASLINQMVNKEEDNPLKGSKFKLRRNSTTTTELDGVFVDGFLGQVAEGYGLDDEYLKSNVSKQAMQRIENGRELMEKYKNAMGLLRVIVQGEDEDGI